MTRHSWFWAVIVIGVVWASCRFAQAQSPSVLYTFDGFAGTEDWIHGGTSWAVLSNTTPGILTITEVGDEFEPNSGINLGEDLTFADGFNRVRESSFSAGGLDATGLDYLEIDLSHNGAGNVNVQFYVQVGYDGETYTWADIPDYELTPNVFHTLSFPLDSLTPEQRTYIRSVGVNVRDHVDLGYLTWQVSELRTVGTPLTVRDLATHDLGTSDGGFNGAYANYGLTAIIGNNGGQNQTGLSINPDGSLQWTDNGTGATMEPSGGAVSWGNGTEFHNSNSFYERPTDVSNYDLVTYRVKATDVVPGGGGVVNIQGFFQTNNYSAHQVAGTLPLPVDGEYHELVFPLGALTNMNVVDAFGLDLNGHSNDVVLNVDYVRFAVDDGLSGDFNDDSKVDAADYVLWRKAEGSQVVLPNDPHGGTIGDLQYNTWKSNFGEMLAGAGNGEPVPEPSATALLFTVIAAIGAGRLRVCG